MRAATLSVLLLAGISFAGCGAGTDAAIDGINASITESSTTHFPADCQRLHTLPYLEQITKLRGEAAVRACEEDALNEESSTPEAVTITAVDVAGDRATANVATAGADFDGQILKVALVEDERWKLDQVIEFVHLDRDELSFEIGRSAFEQAQRPGDADSVATLRPAFRTGLSRRGHHGREPPNSRFPQRWPKNGTAVPIPSPPPKGTPVPRHKLLISSLVLALALGLAACGGGGSDSSGSSDAEGEIETVIETSATSTDPASCAEYSTLLFMEQTTGSEGEEAEKECEEDAENGSNPESVSVSNVEVDGEEATADAAFEGGDLGGQTVSVALIEEEGEWKLNEFTGFASFDAAQLTEALVAQLEETEGVEPETISCISDGLEELDEAEFEGMVIENNTQPFVEIAEGCE